MASDLKFEMFASQFLGSFWFKSGLLLQNPGLSSFPKEYYLDPGNDMYEQSYYVVVLFKLLFYYFVFYDELLEHDTQFEPSPSSISDYISRTCGRDGLFGTQNIFELLFTSLAFVIYLGNYCFRKFSYKDVFYYVHLSWAMYFDEYKEEFYSEGGWSQLKIVSLSYVLPHELLSPYPVAIFPAEENRQDYLLNVMKYVNNYKTFASRIHANCNTVSKAWVKYHLQNLGRYEYSIATIDTVKRQDVKDPKVIENFLLHFRRFCDPKCSEVLDIKAKPKLIASCKNLTEEIPKGLLKFNNLTLSNIIENTGDKEVKQREIEVPLQESKDQTDQLTGIYLPGNKDVASSSNENEASRNASFLKLKMVSNDNFPQIDETQGPSKQELSEETKKEIDLERESSERKCLSRMLLALGNPGGIRHVRSSLLRSNTNEQKE
ncbi:uncharacterized protein TNCT_672341 [Trichonephila clavata]|uniref:Uncharacterized protein n=1 Tax=Trichonephila clavata TaxID=2740835 RepID=A0A8X6KVZ0_TRICU|nr:uncharacterized protein TNCT_672341 [Trichonephila clavata]